MMCMVCAEIRLLGALRMWRVARLINTLLLAADESHNKTRVTLRREEKVIAGDHRFN